MTEKTVCSRCGKPAASEDLIGLCNDCLLAVGLGSVVDATAAGRDARFVPPEVSEIAPYFPQLDISELLGCGGMGAVYKARQKNLDRLVALKILPPDIGSAPAFAERFAREAKALAKLNHPNIVTLYEFGQAGELFYFLMEYVDGVNLGQLLRSGRVSPREALAIVPQICDALQYAHDAGIVHRDIKPENILLDRKGRVKVADFGLAKLVSPSGMGVSPMSDTGETSVPQETTHASLIMGTPQYMAPEQVAHPSDVDHRADIYSLGVVFYQMLTGELPKGDFIAPSKKVVVDVRLDEVVLRAMEKRPELRYQHVSDVKTMVETIASTPQPTRSDSKGKVSPSGGHFSWTVGPLLGSTIAMKEETPRVSQVETSTPPRFSRTAILGACWIAFGLIPVILFAMAKCLAAQQIGESPVQFILLLLGHPPVLALAATFGTTLLLGPTLLGWIAVRQIRRSEGTLYGLGLAVFDGLLLPLLALDTLILAADLSGRHHVTGPGLTPDVTMAQLNIPGWPMLLVFGLIVIVDWLIIRAVWRAVHKPVNNGGPAPIAVPPRGCLGKLIACVAVSLSLGIVGMNQLSDYMKRQDAATGKVVPALSGRWSNFGPVIERTVTNMIDFDTGALIDFPMATQPDERDDARYDWIGGQDGKKPNKESYPWMRAHGVDAVEISHDLENMSLMLVARLEDRDWDVALTPAGGKKLLALTQAGAATESFNGRGTYAIRTREGSLGIVQITDQNLPRGVKLRYRLMAPDTKPERSRFPKAAHSSTQAGTVLVHHDEVDVHYVLFATNAASFASSDKYVPMSDVWVDHGSFKLTERQSFVYHREATGPFHLQLNGKVYDLSQGRVLVLHDDGSVEQLKLFPSLAVANSPDKLVKLFAAARAMNTEPVTPEKLRAQLAAAESQLDDLLKAHAEDKWVLDVRRSIDALHNKLVQGGATNEPAAKPAPAAATPDFSPVRERVLPMSLGVVFQFHSGEVFAPSSNSAATDEGLEKYGQQVEAAGGFDMTAVDVENGIQICGHGCIFTTDVADLKWGAFTPAQVLEAMKRATFTYGVVQPQTKEFPVTYLFKTVRGEVGIMEVSGAVKDERGDGMKFRYKLVQGGATNAPAAKPAPAATALQASTATEDDLVLAGQPPVVVETFPASGVRDVEPGEKEIRVRFSKPMSGGSWSWCDAWSNSLPAFVGSPHYEADARTCVLKANLDAGHTYAFWLNSESFRNFTDKSGHPAVPYLLIFQTKQK